MNIYVYAFDKVVFEKILNKYLNIHFIFSKYFICQEKDLSFKVFNKID